ncbi:MAG TPA: type II secretion system protein [Acidimicrobiales bacterium]|nr:type II secretion system protein [Acidimicrobiales bacterium]
MVSSVISRLNDRRDAAADLGEDAGFTLIELMVVLLILAILLAIAIPTFLGVTGGANDRAAQSNLNTALTATKTQATQLGQTYTGVTTTVMNTAEPSINWNLGGTTISTQGPVSFYVSTDGNGIVLTSYSKSTQTCWYAVDNLATVGTTTNGPYVTAASPGTTGSAPTNAGTYYSRVKSATSCDAASVPTWTGWAANYTAVP